MLQEMLAGSSSAVAVFSPEDVQFLAPRIAKALTSAAAGEAVTFTLTSPRQGGGRLESSVTETTAGSLYVYGLSLYFTLSQYRYAPTQSNADDPAHRRLPDPSGLSNRTLLFTPSAAQRSETFLRPIVGASTDRFLAIDYQLLQHASSPAITAGQPAPQMERAAPIRESPATNNPTSLSSPPEIQAQRDVEILTLKDLVIKKDLELEALRRELQSIRKQLDSQTIKPDTQKRKTLPPSKPPQPVP